MTTTSTHAPAPGARVVVIGAGGNIGSHLVPHLGRLAGIGEVVLVDPGRYEESNVATQDITARHVGLRKAAVQARRLRAINPSLVVRPLACAVEDLPLGWLQADVLLGCLDSRAARQYVNHAAWRLGVPWIDAGVHGDGLLARVSLYRPGSESPCMECAWDDRDYAALEVAYPCAPGAGEPPATGAPSALGALAAALQALECRKLLADGIDGMAFGREVVVDASSHIQYVTAFRRNAGCRMSEHEPWTIERVEGHAEHTTVEQLARQLNRANGRQALWVSGRRFATKLTCGRCGGTRPVLHLTNGRLAERTRCRACKTAMVAAGFDLRDQVDLAELARAAGAHPLDRIGLRSGDVFTVESAGARRHFVLDGPAAASGIDADRVRE